MASFSALVRCLLPMLAPSAAAKALTGCLAPAPPRARAGLLGWLFLFEEIESRGLRALAPPNCTDSVTHSTTVTVLQLLSQIERVGRELLTECLRHPELKLNIPPYLRHPELKLNIPPYIVVLYELVS